jgi:7-cyano-7-deazaguanine synthase
MPDEDCVILLSGGMDSGVLLAWAKKRYEGTIYTLGFSYGSKHNEKELACAKRLSEIYIAQFVLIEMPFINNLFSSSLLQAGENIPDGSYNDTDMRSTVVPFRNGIMLSIAAGFAENKGISKVLIGAHSGDHTVYPDCRPGFIDAMSKASKSGTYANVTIEAPFAAIGKDKIAEIGRSLDFDFSLTWSCYKGGDIHCGTCATCIERKIALEQDKGLDPTRYSS